jgi:hypothetical protein
LIPSTLLGLILLLAGIGPGYVFVREAERREPRIERSQLLEAAELLVVGAVLSTAAALVVLIITQATGALDLEALANNGVKYILREPIPNLTALLATLLLSYGAAYVLARAVHRGRQPTLYPNRAVWWQEIADLKTSGPVFTTVELRDGRVIDGYVSAYTIDADADRRDMALQRPIFVRARRQPNRALLDVDRLILSDREIVYVTLQQHRPPEDAGQ